MADIERNIGLSLGADLCWPACYEQIMHRLDLKIPMGDDTVRFNVERVYIEPFDLMRDCKYDVVIDRLTHWLHTSREWLKKAVILNDLYVFNNPWSLQSMEKHTAYAAMMKLGMPIPTTWMIPPKSYAPSPDLDHTLRNYAKLFDLGKLGEIVGYPLFIKPYDGGGWKSVKKCDDEAAFKAAYEETGTEVMHVQAAIHPSDGFIRTIGMGPQTLCVPYDPSAPLHDRYTRADQGVTAAEQEHLRKITLVINTFFGWEFNSCESMRKDGVWHPMDFANACPDSQVTSLHYYFPWLVRAFIKWSVFCAATDRPMRRTLDWTPYYEIAESDRSFEEKLDAYADIADDRLETERFEEFCATKLSHLDDVVLDFFQTEDAKQAVRAKVAALFPEHEIEEFTELFWSRIQDWRADNGA